MSSNLFTPLKIGAITIPNRVLMAPLTRLRSIEPGDIPTPLMAEYYRQRASAGLIISEATQISAQAKGYAGAPGLHSEAQIAAWKKITAAVHAEQGHIAVQLWHTGRISHASLQPNGQAPVAPSAISAGTRTSLRDENSQATRVDTSMPTHAKRVSTWLNCIPLTATCCINSCHQRLTSVPINTAVVLKTVLVWYWKSSMQVLKNGVPIALVSVFPLSARSRTSTTVRMKRLMLCT